MCSVENENIGLKREKEMVESAENNTNQFWKTIGRVGIIVNRKKEIPMEILNDGGEVIQPQTTSIKISH